MIIPKKSIFLDYNLNFHKMIDIHSKHNNMHKNGMFNALISLNNHIITCIDCMLSELYLLIGLNRSLIKYSIY